MYNLHSLNIIDLNVAEIRLENEFNWAIERVAISIVRQFCNHKYVDKMIGILKQNIQELLKKTEKSHEKDMEMAVMLANASKMV